MQAKDKTKLTFEKANALLRYYPDTGLLYWKVAKGVRRAGDIAGRVDSKGHYLWTVIDGVKYANHRLAWLLTHHQFPLDQLDHINRDKQDNRLDNLRECSMAENCQNRAIYQTNQWGFAGVAISRNKYKAVIQVDGVKKSIGVWNSPEEAHAVYLAVKDALHPFAMRKNLGSSQQP
jgi:hypothetical protein